MTIRDNDSSIVLAQQLYHHKRQCSRHKLGKISSRPISFCGHDSSTPTIWFDPLGQLIFNSINFPVIVSSVPSADALAQSSQYHHFSLFPVQGGNEIHDM
mmetsp:Transcript_35040/g.64381  ORF Transcript_35040/g.64381 Transcript_35040/m.64381 type:complete len:100 (+) Transcript_35040:1-300(+)